jgi:hypothetical protein
MSSFFIQLGFMIVSTSLITTRIVSQSAERTSTRIQDRTFSWHDLCPIALLAFQSAGQVIAGRTLKYNALPTLVLTSLLCDLMSDTDLLTVSLKNNPDRNRKVLALALLFAGAAAAGAISKTALGFGGALWVATGVKGVMVVAWLVWSPKKETG